MPDSNPQIGDVYYYPYVWNCQFQGAVAEKDRPCCVAIRLQTSFKDGCNVFMLAISTTGFPEGGMGLEIPTDEIRRISGLNASQTHWLTTSEDNRTIHTSPVFDPSEYRGTFSNDFMKNTVFPHIKALVLGGGMKEGGAAAPSR